MDSKYVYKGQDITFDTIIKIENVVEQISQRENKSFDECFENFSKSRTYKALQNTNSLMWAENAEFIVAEFYREVA